MVEENRVEDVFQDSAERRTSDIQQEKIDSLIAQEEDSKTRLTLMIMSSINKAIANNTALTHVIHREVSALKDELESHVTDSAAALNQGKGMYKVMKVITPAIWAITCAVMAAMYNSYSGFHEEVTDSLSKITLKLQNFDDRLEFYGAKNNLPYLPPKDKLK